jgi:hypothetical protein
VRPGAAQIIVAWRLARAFPQQYAEVCVVNNWLSSSSSKIYSTYSQSTDMLADYSIHALQHQYASWCAARAVAVPCASITNEAVLAAIEAAGLHNFITSSELLPATEMIDSWHRDMRLRILQALSAYGYKKSHGVAAKIINIYFKTIFCHPGSCHDPSVMAMHPPIDSEVVSGIHAFGNGNDALWRGVSWTKLSSDEYDALVADIRARADGRPLWQVEQLWRGRTA